MRKTVLFAALAGLLALLANPMQAEENASNPLAAVNNTDLRVQGRFDGSTDTFDYYIDGAYMVTPKLKLKYELHYLSTDVTGSTEHDFEKLSLKPIYFPTEGKLNDSWAYRLAVGVEAIIDLGDTDKGIGMGSDQIAPLFGAAFANPETRWTLIPLVQHFADVNGDTDISQTSARLIAIHPFGDANWVKFDLKLPYDWENDALPATAEIQLGNNINEGRAFYVDGLFGLGSDRPYDFGLGLGLRFNY